LKKLIAGIGPPREAPQGASTALQASDDQSRTYHMTANQHLRVIDKDHARIDAYYITLFGGSRQETPARE